MPTPTSPCAVQVSLPLKSHHEAHNKSLNHPASFSLSQSARSEVTQRVNFATLSHLLLRKSRLLCRKQGEQFSCYEERFYSFNHTTDDGAGSLNKSKNVAVIEKLILLKKVFYFLPSHDAEDFLILMVDSYDTFYSVHDKHAIFEQSLGSALVLYQSITVCIIRVRQNMLRFNQKKRRYSPFTFTLVWGLKLKIIN